MRDSQRKGPGILGRRHRVQPWGLALIALVGAGIGCRDLDRPVPGMELDGVALSEAAARGRRVFREERCDGCHIRGGPSAAAFRGAVAIPGGRRVGPQLGEVAGRYTEGWHLLHLRDPRAVRPGSSMPAYPWLFSPEGAPTGRALDLVAYLGAQRRHPSLEDPSQVVAAALKAEPPSGAGAKIFARACAGCHGAEGGGDGAAAASLSVRPANLHLPRFKWVPRGEDGRLELEALLWVIVAGLPRAEMPRTSDLPPEELRAVAEEVRALAGTVRVASEAALPAGWEAEGEASVGAELYAQLGCVRCHGARGEGAMIPGGVEGPALSAGEARLARGRWAWAIWRGVGGGAMPAYHEALEIPGTAPGFSEGGGARLAALINWLGRPRPE